MSKQEALNLDFNRRAGIGIMTGIVGTVVNTVIALTKIVVGFLFVSMAIIADGVHNLLDSASSLITLVGFKLAKAPPDKEHPFGHRRIEYITGLIIAIVIVVVGCLLLQTAILRIITPQKFVLEGYLITLILLGATVAGKAGLFIFYRYFARKTGSTAIMAAAWDSLFDCLTTSVVITSVIVFKHTGVNVDGYFASVVAVIIVVSGIILIKQATSPLIGERPRPEAVAALSKAIGATGKIYGFHDLIIHSYGPGTNFASVHIEVDAGLSLAASHELADEIERKIFAEYGYHLVVHVDPVDRSPAASALAEDLQAFIAQIDSRLKLYNLRINEKDRRPEVSFDILLPADCRLSGAALKQEITQYLRNLNQNYRLKVTINYNYL